MKILALETSTDTGSVAVAENGVILAERVHRAPMKLLSWLAGAVSSTLEETGMKFEDLDAIAAGTGPGSFTGVRLELATARTLCQVRKIPLYGIPSLESLAFRALPYKGILLSLIDARRGEWFAEIYKADGLSFTSQNGPLRLPKEEILKKLAELRGPYFITGGEKKDRDFFRENLASAAAAPEERSVVLASSAALLAFGRARQLSGNLHTVHPLYFRPSQAEWEREKKAGRCLS